MLTFLMRLLQLARRHVQAYYRWLAEIRGIHARLHTGGPKVLHAVTASNSTETCIATEEQERLVQIRLSWHHYPGQTPTASVPEPVIRWDLPLTTRNCCSRRRRLL